MLRLKERLGNPLREELPFEGQHGYIVSVGKARAFFLSAEPQANVVGATASLLLEVDEAQDVDLEKHDRDLVPMAASTNAPRAYYGTAGRQDDLLQQVKAANLAQERRDGVRRHFEYPWWVVAEQNPEYGRFVEAERDRLGATHPTFLTQYELKPVAGKGGFLDEEQLRRLQGDHPRERSPRPGRTYVAGVDVAGPAESAVERHDSTVITIAEVVSAEEGRIETLPDGSTIEWAPSEEEAPAEPTLRVVEIVEWRGRSHAEQHRELLRLLDATWRCRSIAFDATGLGQAPCELLRARLGERVVPVVLTARRKSQLGFDLIGAINGRRVTMWAAGPEDEAAREFWGQIRGLRRDLRPGGLMGWGAGSSGGHDDFATSLALAVFAGRSGASLWPEPACVVIPGVSPYANEGIF
jgi:hypothetical protein